MATEPDFVFDEHVPSGGACANDARVWHTRHEFTVDFLARWLYPSHDDDPLLIVARVRIPSTAMFDIVREMSNCIGEYEAEHGRLTPPPTEAS